MQRTTTLRSTVLTGFTQLSPPVRSSPVQYMPLLTLIPFCKGSRRSLNNPMTELQFLGGANLPCSKITCCFRSSFQFKRGSCNSAFRMEEDTTSWKLILRPQQKNRNDFSAQMVRIPSQVIISKLRWVEENKKLRLNKLKWVEETKKLREKWTTQNLETNNNYTKTGDMSGNDESTKALESHNANETVMDNNEIGLSHHNCRDVIKTTENNLKLVVDNTTSSLSSNEDIDGISYECKTYHKPVNTGGLGEHFKKLSRIYDKVLVVDNISMAKEMVGLLTTQYKHLVHACDTEVATIDVRKETPVDHGEVICFSIYSGPEVDFDNGKSCIWVDVLDGGGRDILIKFAPFFEDPSIKKVWHNYGFDSHIIENYGIKLHGFHADTMHMARLWDSSRRNAGGYSLEALTSDEKVMSGDQPCTGGEELIDKVSMKTIFGKKTQGKMDTRASLLQFLLLKSFKGNSEYHGFVILP